MLMTNILAVFDSTNIKIDHHIIIEKFNFKLIRGDLLLINGPTGTGKSTLLKEMAKQKYYNQNYTFSYVPQNISLNFFVPISVNDFLQLNNNCNQQQITDILQKIHCNHLINKQINQLSGGEIKCITIARALLRQSNIILLDEPTHGMDTAKLLAFCNIINQIKKQHTIAIVSHNNEVIEAINNNRCIQLNYLTNSQGSTYNIIDV